MFGSIESKHGLDEQQPAEERATRRWHQRPLPRALAAGLVVLLLVGWRAGTFDHVLVNVGLNAKPCARNGFGAVFCGKELTEYRERIANGEKQGKEASEKIERESKEAGAKAERELKETEQRSEESVERGEEENQRQDEGG
jgi:hypothetical protein